MDNLLANPAVQSAVLPMVLALAWVFGFRHRPIWAGLAGLLAFGITVYFVNGMQWLPLTSTRKIIISAGIFAILGVLWDWIQTWRETIQKNNPTVRFGLTVLIALIALTWVLWPLLLRSLQWHHGVLFLFVAWQVSAQELLRHRKVTVTATINPVALGIGVSLVCLLGASALYGQLATPFSVVVGVWLLFYLLKKTGADLPTGLYLPAVMVPAILAAAATVYASLPLSSLAFIALIPLMAYIPLAPNLSVWITLLLHGLLALIPVGAVVIYLLLQASQESAYYG
ncbi:MAG: hypothetical protein OEZ68_01030 [Gammaproteobacteria bacterium]|nr:hypothetical protein [Gammaproteobacteria bacterium]MDH5799362.1 hypothetical protein [Gammaproteobacteria bacterium]